MELPVILILLTLCLSVSCGPGNEPLYSTREVTALSQFRKMVEDELYEDYMKTDAFLIRWIRDKNFDLDKATEKLTKALNWRRENSIDTIATEKIGNMDRQFPYDLGGRDKEGRPILLIRISKYDIRKWMVGHGVEGRKQLARYNDQMFERGAALIRMNKNPTTGKSVTQCVVICDLNGFNQRQHSCAACLPYYYDLLTHYEAYYPQLVSNFFFINTPKIFQTVIRLLLPIISPATNSIIKLFGHDKSEWDLELKKKISSNQLPPHFGGTKAGRVLR